MTDTTYIRQHNILDPERAASTHVTIVGCGTVGSNAAIQLAKAGIGSFDLWDDDAVEQHNLPSQDFTAEDVGEQKVKAVAARVKAVNPAARVSVSDSKMDAHSPLKRGFLVLAVDSMKARAEVFDLAKRSHIVPAVIDFRMGGWVLQSWVAKMDEAERYEATLYSDDEVVAATCGTQSFAPVGAMSGALATAAITRLVMGRPTPFYTNADLESLVMAGMGWPAEEGE